MPRGSFFSRKSFTRWLAKPEVKRLGEAALAGMSMLNEDSDRRRIRRPLTAAETARLIQAVESSPAVMGMAGSDRAILYASMLATELRKVAEGQLPASALGTTARKKTGRGASSQPFTTTGRNLDVEQCGGPSS